MGMGFAACSAYVVEEAKVRELCPEPFAAFVAALRVDSNFVDCGFEEDDEELLISRAVCQDLQFSGGEQSLDENTQRAWSGLLEAFKLVTGGLELGVGYHDQADNGSRYDEVDGHFWQIVGGLYELTPAGKAFEGNFERKTFVELC